MADKRLTRIPLPPLPVQGRIANGVHKIREKSKQLKKEAKELLEKAKREVENIILGEERSDDLQRM